MTRQEFLQLLEEVIEAEPGTLKGDERLRDLERWDSLAVMSYIALVDEQLGISVSAQSIAEARTVSDLVALVERQLSG